MMAPALAWYAWGMDERSSRRKKRDHDFSITAFSVVQQATDQGVEATVQPESANLPTDEKNPNAVALGRLGGKKGGPARASKLTQEQRHETAKKAAHARWSKQNLISDGPKPAWAVIYENTHLQEISTQQCNDGLGGSSRTTCPVRFTPITAPRSKIHPLVGKTILPG
jgi:hypothetical protein